MTPKEIIAERNKSIANLQRMIIQRDKEELEFLKMLYGAQESTEYEGLRFAIGERINQLEAKSK